MPLVSFPRRKVSVIFIDQNWFAFCIDKSNRYPPHPTHTLIFSLHLRQLFLPKITSILLDFTLRSTIHFWVNFVYTVKYGQYSLLHMDIHCFNTIG